MSPSPNATSSWGFQLDHHVEGTVDAYFGPPELATAVKAAPPVEPRTLVAAAEALLDELGDGLAARPGGRAAHLRRRAGGEARPYADEVEGCYGVRPTYTTKPSSPPHTGGSSTRISPVGVR